MMDIGAYLTPLRRWWWLIVIATLTAALASFLATYNQPPVYQASTTLMVGRIVDDPNPNQGEITLAQSLARTYADIANREPVRNATMQALELNRLPQYLARALPQTQLIEIAVIDVNPLRAQVVANELANQLIRRSPGRSGSEDQDRQQFVSNQLDILQTQIEDTQNEIATLQEQLGTLNSARQLQETQTQITALQTKLNTLQTNFSSLLATTQQGASNTLTVIEEANLPRRPMESSRILSILLSGAIGFALAAGAAYLLEYLDDTFKSPEEIMKMLGLPVIGFIADTHDKTDGNESVYVSKHPRSPITEAFRSMRANIEFAAVDKPLRSILITSADTEAGKSSIAANLSVILAQGGKKVVLVDADLRMPNIHRLTNLDLENGLSDLFLNGTYPIKSLKEWNEGGLDVITGGKLPPNPSELLGSKRMDDILNELSDNADIVIIDSSPFVVSDSLMLSTKVDGVIIVIRPGKTRKKYIKTMMEQLNRAGARVIGVVMNRIPHHGADYYGGYLYHSPYYADQNYTSVDGFEGRWVKTREKLHVNKKRNK